jgi:hypothetical protein
MITEIQSAWLRCLFSIVPSERPRAEAALRALYPDVFHREPPQFFFWFDSPEHAGWAVTLFANQHHDRAFVEQRERTAVGRRFMQSLRAELCHKAGLEWGELMRIVGMGRTQQHLWNPLRLKLHGLDDLYPDSAVSTHPRHGEFQIRVRPLLVGPGEQDPVRRVEDRFHDAIISRTHRLLSLAYNKSSTSPYTYAKMAQDEAEAVSSGRPVPPAIAAGWELARSAGECWVFEGAAVFLERPADLRLNSEMLLHCDDGPAITFRDGTKVWVWNGIIADEETILHSEDIPTDKWRRLKPKLAPEFVARIEARRAKVPKPPELPKPKRAPAVVNPKTLLTRYQAGECEAVWKDLMALGPDVRKSKYQAPAEAVVKETMRRAKHNFELIENRLKSLEYEFFLEGNVKDSPLWEEAMGRVPEIMPECENAGLLIPAALQAFFLEDLCAVSLLGTHPVLCPNGQAALADPVEFSPNPDFGAKLSEWEDRDPDDFDPDEFIVELCASPSAKEQLMDGSLGERYYGIQLPDGSADAVLVGEPEGRTLVEYLRWSFQWAGFPGWEKQKKRPERELTILREGLLPV